MASLDLQATDDFAASEHLQITRFHRPSQSISETDSSPSPATTPPRTATQSFTSYSPPSLRRRYFIQSSIFLWFINPP
jgi:hypothetical protein